MLDKTKSPTNDEIAAWFKGKQFTTNWTTQYIPSWNAAFTTLNTHDRLRILEIGTWEGRSTVALLNLLPNSSITCVDAWRSAEGQERMKRFDANMREFSDRFEKCQCDSLSALLEMIAARKSYNIIYIDGDHRQNSVLADSLYAWQLLKAGGIMIWDDYQWEPGFPDESKPHSAIDWFLKKFSGRYSVLHQDYQVIIRKNGQIEKNDQTSKSIFSFFRKR